MLSYDDVKENLTSLLMSAREGVCPTDVDDISDALTLIEQQAQEIDRLRSFITRYRYQIKGGEAMQRYIDERVLIAPEGEGE